MELENDMTDASNRSSHSGGVGFAGLLTVVFITLKLCKVIAWSWLWVLSPIWISAAFCLTLLAVLGIAALAVVARSRR